MENSLIRGTFFLTAASFISKILGFIYIIPFTALVGTSGYALYKYAYGPYTIILSLSTIGLPLAVSKFVSKYNGLGNYRVGLDLLKVGFILMVVTGFLSFGALYSLAPFLSKILIDPHDVTGNSQQDVTFVIRMVSFALLIVPPMSLLRGYFQGSQSMGPSALSTVIEQIVRIIFILLGGFIAIHIFHSTITKAVGIATFGAFIGGAAGLVVLLSVYVKRRELIRKQMNESPIKEKIHVIPMLKELISYAIPFVIVGLTIPIYQNIDTFTINKLFQSIGYQLDEAEVINSVIGLAQILVMVPVSLATAFGMSLIPGITTSFVTGNIREVHRKITKTIQILVFFTLPAGIGLSLLGKPIYTMIFGLKNNDEVGGTILQWYALATIVFALFTVTAAILQGINEQKKVIIGVALGVIVKMILNVVLVSSFKEVAPVLATYGGFSVSVIFNMVLIKKTIQYEFFPLIKSLLQSVGLGLVMAFSVLFMNFFMDTSISGRISEYYSAVLTSLVCITTGLFVYLGIGMKTQIMKDVLNRRKKMDYQRNEK
ncbi:polysaccharide biosynthesis protein [Bacillus sp. FJAT-47783]|uniref:putative polysaccharide biosynthesis protein n=1 Tax=Bacillus sp. FJAT-47783 TaxID=2922712 RepID=UPI001FAB3C78|nr:polysaccharide biosynthesis protein [Bacillus sp. FJAT-47783]